MKTSFPKPAEPKWYVVDASSQTLGRIAADVAHVLRGKHKPTFVPHLLSGDHVVVINAKQVKLTGNKEEGKIYYRHTGYFGHLRQAKASRMREERPEDMITLAVKGMLPKNASRVRILKRLHVYADAEHQHTNHELTTLTIF